MGQGRSHILQCTRTWVVFASAMAGLVGPNPSVTAQHHRSSPTRRIELTANQPESQTPEQIVEQAFDEAAKSLQQGRHGEALGALQAIEAVEPKNPWLWYFRGTTHRSLGDPYKAMEAYDRALDELAAAGNPDPQLVERILWERRAARRQVFSLSAQIGLAYDSNVSFTGDGSTTAIVSGRGDGKFASLLQLDYVPHITNEDAVAVGLRLNHTWHFSIEEFNYQQYGGYVRYTRRLAEKWVFDIRYDYDLSYLGNESFSSIHAITPRISYRWAEGDSAFRPVESGLFYRIQAKDFLFSTDSRLDRDGFANAVGLEQSFLLTPDASKPNWVWDVFAGYQLESDATQGREFDRLSNDFYLGLSVPVRNPLFDNKDLTFQFLASWELDRYRNPSLYDRRRRERRDLITTLGVVISQLLVSDPHNGDLILHGILNWTDADSNIKSRDGSEPFTYDKLVAGFQLEWRF
jgi:hypothetical protein